MNMTAEQIQPNIHENIFLSMSDFLLDWHVRVGWIAFSVLWLMWAIAWVLRHIFGGDTAPGNAVVTDPTAANTTTAAGTGAGTGTTTDPEVAGGATGANAATGPNTTGAGNNKMAGFLGRAPTWGQKIFNRFDRAQELLRDLVLMLLSVMVINTFARGSTRGVMILAWIFLAFAVVLTFVEGAVAHRFIRFSYALIFFVIALIILGFAWAQGFY
ncbi:hypothetical protein BCR43DRAFT_519751 [Syncephalastrum racemosum]|uniref:Uncharacterized protein n=1 Tax=Syncephalastrum racemosum TaxID=13706 RepID=A0A1X2HS71_SYNRA|nr:hypothetical protein BCR43DRAFT_519751 [Syncephalastrum racemosum]